MGCDENHVMLYVIYGTCLCMYVMYISYVACARACLCAYVLMCLCAYVLLCASMCMSPGTSAKRRLSTATESTAATKHSKSDTDQVLHTTLQQLIQTAKQQGTESTDTTHTQIQTYRSNCTHNKHT
jgi:hypothetical protein